MSLFDPLPHDPTPAAAAHTPAARPPRRARWSDRLALPAACLAASLALLAGCGGGGGEASTTSASGSTVSTASATDFTEGAITGFGSVIVNGVRYDDSSVKAVDDSGSEIKMALGMTAAVDSGTVDTSSRSAKAHGIRVGSRLRGPVEAGSLVISGSSGSLVVLGQPVDVTDSTVFDDTLAAGLSALSDGAVVEVHALPDSATGRLVATRIESKTSATAYKLVGTVSGLDTTAKSFSIGAAKIAYASATALTSTLADGATVRVTLATTAPATSADAWTATRVDAGRALVSTDTGSVTTVAVRGDISSFTSATSFTVAGVKVDASGATVTPTGSTLAAGVSVVVKGSLSNGVLVATSVVVDSYDKGNGGKGRFELHGTVGSLDTTAKTFVVVGSKVNVTVDYSSSLTWTNGTEATLANGVKVEVRGGVGSTRTKIVATAIKFES
ncbi:DUF5666 domain-containing protein [Aquabacterium sp. OR-4]|uniref:DUF5666 domain-containing protein n=1 Tax=Aquabacterium sp. OR-4 TaxID=2978127 RepID=UPI0028C7DE1F|nr:DUF5666 domain-containing protein [Aquabacterium sp. OR-4]MDT7836802.1 DUF5666 domain-containing protein [Aquabacterium sp. OR-4]